MEAEPFAATQDMGLEYDEPDVATLDELRCDLFGDNATAASTLAPTAAPTVAPAGSTNPPTAEPTAAPTAAPGPAPDGSVARRTSSRPSLGKGPVRFAAGPSGSMDSRLGSRHARVRDKTYTELEAEHGQLKAEGEALNAEIERLQRVYKAEAAASRKLREALNSCLAAEQQELSPREQQLAALLQQALVHGVDGELVREQVVVRLHLSTAGVAAGKGVGVGLEMLVREEGEADDQAEPQEPWQSPPIAPAAPAPTVAAPAPAAAAPARVAAAPAPAAAAPAPAAAAPASAPAAPAPAPAAPAPAPAAPAPAPVPDLFARMMKAGGTLKGTKALEAREAAAAATAAPTAANPAAAIPAAATTPVKYTRRVLAGRELYAMLKEVGSLQHDHKMKRAAEVLASLHPPPAPTDLQVEAREDALARRRAIELRDFTFSFGGLSLTRQVLARLLEMREVKLLLPEQLQERQSRAKDEETAQLLLRAAKTFFCELMKQREGRRSDVNRNAFIAGLVTLLPRDLFQNKRGRAAMRILGLSYRQAKLGSEARGVMEDCGKGWQLVTTKYHYDKVHWKRSPALQAAWHSDIFSSPDNQNKEKYQIDLGIDPRTKETLYGLHSRRAQNGTDKALLKRFREAPEAAEFRAMLAEETSTRGRAGGVKVGPRQWRESKCECIRKRKASECDCYLHTEVTPSMETPP